MVSSITRTQSSISDGYVASLASNFVPSLLSLPKTPLFGTDGIRGKVGELLKPRWKPACAASGPA